MNKKIISITGVALVIGIILGMIGHLVWSVNNLENRLTELTTVPLMNATTQKQENVPINHAVGEIINYLNKQQK